MIMQRGAVTLEFDATLYPVVYTSGRFQSVGVSTDGQVQVFDGNVTEQFIALKLKHRTHSELNDIRQFIESVVMYGKYPFTITPEADQNFDTTDGAAISVRYWASDFLETQPVYHRYEYDIILRIE